MTGAGAKGSFSKAASVGKQVQQSPDGYVVNPTLGYLNERDG